MRLTQHTNSFEWIVINPSKEHCFESRLGWWLGEKIANYRKSYGLPLFNIKKLWIRRWLVVFFTSFVEANLKTR